MEQSNYEPPRHLQMLADYLYKVSVAMIVGVVIFSISETIRHIEDMTPDFATAIIVIVVFGTVTSVLLAASAYYITKP